MSDDTGHDDLKTGDIRHADKPFLFFIMDRTIDMVLYAGRVTNPKGWQIAGGQAPTHTSSKGESHWMVG